RSHWMLDVRCWMLPTRRRSEHPTSNIQHPMNAPVRGMPGESAWLSLLLSCYAQDMTRVDQALVERGLCDSREKAKRAVLAGEVRINGQPARKPSDPVKPADALTLAAPE